MGSFSGGHLRLTPNEVPIWRRVARRLSVATGTRLNFAQAAIAYANAIDTGALELVREEWRGDILAEEVIDAMAAMLRGDAELMMALAGDDSLADCDVRDGETATLETGRWRVSIAAASVGVLE